MSVPHILVAGAGIGGLTAAIALARRGFSVTVVEKRTGFGEVGAGIQLSPNAGRVLDALDLALPLRRHVVRTRRLVVRRWRDGRELVTMPMSDEGAEPFRAVRRADIHTVLLDAARSLPAIRFIVGRAVEAVVEHANGIAVTIRGGNGHREDIAANALIGADGLWSNARTLSGDTAPPAFTGYEAWRTLIPASGDVLPEVTLRLGSGHHAVCYPVTGGREINLVVIRQAREAREGWSREGDATTIAADLKGADPALRDLGKAAPGWLIWSLFDRPPAAMANGRIALLGDAAHPVLPFLAQGAALAIEDAAVLARLLAEAAAYGGSEAIPAALAAYAQARRARAARVQAQSRSNGRTYHLGLPWSLGRDMVMRRLGPAGMRARQNWLYDWRDD